MSESILMIPLAPLYEPLEFFHTVTGTKVKGYKPLDFLAQALGIFGSCSPEFKAGAGALKDLTKTLEAADKLRTPEEKKSTLQDRVTKITERLNKLKDKDTNQENYIKLNGALKNAKEFLDKQKDLKANPHTRFSYVEAVLSPVVRLSGSIAALSELSIYLNTYNVTPQSVLALGNATLGKVTDVAVGIFGQNAAIVGSLTLKSVKNVTNLVVLSDLILLSYNLSNLENDQLKFVEILPLALKLTLVAASVFTLPISASTLAIISLAAAYLDLTNEYAKTKKRNTLSNELENELNVADHAFRRAYTALKEEGLSTNATTLTKEVATLKGQLDAALANSDRLARELEEAKFRDGQSKGDLRAEKMRVEAEVKRLTKELSVANNSIRTQQKLFEEFGNQAREEKNALLAELGRPVVQVEERQ